MPFVPLATLMFLLGDVFDGRRQQDDPASVPLLTPHAGGGIEPPPLWVVHRGPALRRACEAVCARGEWAIVLLLPAGPVPHADDCTVPEVVRIVNVPHVAITSLRDAGAVEEGHTDVGWLEPHRCCWVPAATKVTSSDASPREDGATNMAVASHGSPTWTGAIHSTVPEAEIIGAAAYLLHTSPRQAARET